LSNRGQRPKLGQARALYLGAVGLALTLFGFALFSRRDRTGVRSTAGTPMRGEDSGAGSVAGFRIIRQIGQGGMGIVYEGYDETLQRRVALKRMREEIASLPRERHRFLKEARTVAALRHPGIVEIFQVVEQGEALWLVFEFLPGQTLDEVIHRKGRLAHYDVLPLARQIAEALDAAHAQGVVHQDLKPSNVLVSASRAKVMDFGIARRVQETLSTLSRAEVSGTPAYMAPEQENGIVTPAADLYGFGACLYEMFSGQAPFGHNAGLMAKAEKRFAPLTALGVPPAAEAVISQALEPDASKRPASACAMVAALESAFTQQRV
jgi:eukaryotic-like serine/threonine-protein kinase